MDEKQLLDIEARANAATPGPWRNDRPPEHHYAEVWGARGPGYGTIVCAYPSRPIEAEANKDFIAHARTDIPALIASLRAERKLVEAASVALGELIELANTPEHCQDAEWNGRYGEVVLLAAKIAGKAL